LTEATQTADRRRAVWGQTGERSHDGTQRVVVWLCGCAGGRLVSRVGGGTVHHLAPVGKKKQRRGEKGGRASFKRESRRPLATATFGTDQGARGAGGHCRGREGRGTLGDTRSGRSAGGQSGGLPRGAEGHSGRLAGDSRGGSWNMGRSRRAGKLPLPRTPKPVPTTTERRSGEGKQPWNGTTGAWGHWRKAGGHRGTVEMSFFRWGTPVAEASVSVEGQGLPAEGHRRQSGDTEKQRGAVWGGTGRQSAGTV
jgi:hypothetical protein